LVNGKLVNKGWNGQPHPRVLRSEAAVVDIRDWIISPFGKKDAETHGDG